MPKFAKLNPKDVHIGRSAHEARQPYRDALTGSDAGRIELGQGDVPSTVKRHLSLAAQETGTKVRSSWEDKRQLVLLWKKSGR
ncbi:MAG: hypothetical protein IH800_17545 [Myxococcales bacterium]|nr:hypothetical protein [Myxococcales bacterium]